MIKHKKGFTLIELLIVIAVIALLVSIIVPALKKAKGFAKMIVCRSNMQQIGLAAHLYAQANDNYVPRGGINEVWFTGFLPYLGHESNTGDYRNVKIYRCPSFRDKQQTVCYVVNAWTFDSSTDTTGHQIGQQMKLDVYRSPFSKVYLADNEEGSWRPIIENATDPDIDRLDIWNPGHLPDSISEDIDYGRRIAQNRHRDGANYMFYDWHAGYIATEEMNINYWRDK